MKKVKMNHSTQGSPDGMRVTIYQKDYEYNLPDSLADTFIAIGAAVAVNPPRQRREKKAVAAAPENAAMNAAPENASAKPKEKPEVVTQVTRVYQLAEELDLPSKKIIGLAKKIGIHVGAPASGLSEDEVERIKKALKR